MDDERLDEEVPVEIAPTSPEDDLAEQEAQAAAQEAAGIGGPPPRSDADEAMRPLEEAGQGEAEGFELAERDLEEHATHGDSGPDPLSHAGLPEERSGQEHGEADQVIHPDGPSEQASR